jgi:DNA repair exonuclease SbcCD ATPase subunit
MPTILAFLQKQKQASKEGAQALEEQVSKLQERARKLEDEMQTQVDEEMVEARKEVENLRKELTQCQASAKNLQELLQSVAQEKVRRMCSTRALQVAARPHGPLAALLPEKGSWAVLLPEQGFPEQGHPPVVRAHCLQAIV